MNASVDPGLFVKQLFATILITNPVNFFLICFSLFLAFKTRLPVLKKDLQLILCCSLPLIAILLFISLFRETYAHWSGPGFSTLLLLPAVKLASDRSGRVKKLIPKQVKWALGFCIIFIFSEIMITWFYPGTVSNQKDGLNIGKGDFSLDMYGWKNTGQSFDSFYRHDVSYEENAPKRTNHCYAVVSRRTYRLLYRQQNKTANDRIGRYFCFARILLDESLQTTIKAG